MSTTAQVLRITSDTGDWSAYHDGLGVSSCQAIQDEVGNVVALVVAQSDDYYADPDPEPYSRLFAAAPDLLEALIECVEDSQAVVDQYVLSYGENWRPAKLAALRAGVKRARAAIKKATGE